MKVNALITLAAICASHVALAADIAPIINPLIEATKTMDRCAAIAKGISSIKPPPGSAEASVAENFNFVVSEAHAKAQLAKAPSAPPKAIDPTLLKKIPPQQQAFLSDVRAKHIPLEQCGEEFSKVWVEIEAHAKRTSDSFADPQKKPNEDDKKVVAALTGYMQSGKNLSAAIAALSKDPVLSRYVSGTTRKYFLGNLN